MGAAQVISLLLLAFLAKVKLEQIDVMGGAVSSFSLSKISIRSSLVPSHFAKIFKIFRHIKSLDACMKH